MIARKGNDVPVGQLPACVCQIGELLRSAGRLCALVVMLVALLSLRSSPCYGYPGPSENPSVPAVPTSDLFELTSQEKAWIKAHAMVRLGFYPGAEPMLIQDVNGGLAGVFPDMFAELSRLTGLEFSIEVYPWHEVQSGVKDRELDGFLACTPTLATEHQLAMTIPFSRIVPTVFARMDAPFEVASMEDLAGKRVALVKGVRLQEGAVEEVRDRISIIETTGALENLKAVLAGKADVAIGYGFDDYIAVKNNITSVVPVFVDSDHSADVVCATRCDWPELTSILNKGLMAMGEKRINEIHSRWVYIPRVSPGLVLTDEEKIWLEGHPVVRLGFNPDMEPLLIQADDGSLIGFYPDVFHKLGEVVGVDFDIEVGDWASIVADARTNEIDGLLSCSEAQAISSNLLRSKPIHTMHPLFLVKQDAQFPIDELDDLVGKSVAYHNGVAALEHTLEPYRDSAHCMGVQNTLEALRFLLEGKADIVCALSFETYLLAKHSIAGVQVAHLDLTHDFPRAACIRSDWPELVTIINKGLDNIGFARIEESLAQWTTIPPPTQLTREQEKWLSSHTDIRLGFNSSWHPFAFVDRGGKSCGMVSELIKVINDRIGNVMQPQAELTWSKMLENAKRGEIDVIPAIVRSPDRESYLQFSNPYLTLPLVVVTRSDFRAISGLADLVGDNVSLVRGTMAQKYLERDYPEHVLLLCDRPQEALELVSDGEADAMVVTLPCATYAERRLGLDNLRVAATTEYEYELRMGVRRDWPEFVGILNKELARIGDREKSLMLDKWANVQVERETDWRTVLYWAVFIFIMAGGAVVFFWRSNRRLLHEIVQRKRAEAGLQDAKDDLEIRVRQRTVDLEEANKALRASESNLSKAQEVARIGSWHLDLIQNSLTWTDETYRIFGIPIGTPLDYEGFLDCVHEDDMDYVRRRWSAALRGEVYDVEHRIVVDGQTKWIRDKAELEFDEQGVATSGIGIAQDITERKQAEQDKTVLQEQLNQAQKMEAVGQLAGGVAHDFNNLLVVIFANIQRIASKVQADLLPEGSLEMLNEAAEQAASVTKSLLTFSRKVSAEKRRVNLCEIAQKSGKMLTRMLPSTIELSTEIPDESVWVTADATQLLQVIMNLSINARDAMPEGGRLSIAVSVSSEDDIFTVDGVHADESTAYLTISDTGTGITPQDRCRIFDPFFTTKPRGQGTGLGLAIVHGIVKDHGGDIGVETTVGLGTSFRISLPLVKSAAEVELGIEESAPAQGKGELVLVAEDRESVRALVVSTLSSLGYEVVQAEDGESLMSEMERHKEEIRAMVLDVDLPKRSGLSCLAEIRERGLDTPAIIITATADIGDPERDFPNTQLLRKPFKMAELGRRVGEMLAAHRVKVDTLG